MEEKEGGGEGGWRRVEEGGGEGGLEERKEEDGRRWEKMTQRERL